MSQYDRYKAMTDEQIQKAIDDGTVSVEYLNWLGITGNGKLAREIISQENNDNATD
jgi:bacterioferritin-associated ferredoxin